MHYPELTIADVTPHHIDTYLNSLQRMIESITELAEEWRAMDEAEQYHFRLDFSHAFGLRRLVGMVYTAGQLSSSQIAALTTLDRQLLAQAAAIETIYGFTLRQLVRDLFTWGTPLATQTSTLQIETTTTALAELVAT
jgi:hypothetical protein